MNLSERKRRLNKSTDKRHADMQIPIAKCRKYNKKTQFAIDN